MKLQQIVGGLLVVGVATCVGGCVTSEGENNPYAAEFAAAREAATSEFEASVLADDEITKAEYDEANQRWANCVQENGYKAWVEDTHNTGVYVYATEHDAEDGDISQEILDSCARGTTEVVATLYVEVLTNPEKRDQAELVLQCLKRKGIVENSLTTTEFKEYYDNGHAPPGIDETATEYYRCSVNPMAQ